MKLKKYISLTIGLICSTIANAQMFSFTEQTQFMHNPSLAGITPQGAALGFQRQVASIKDSPNLIYALFTGKISDQITLGGALVNQRFFVQNNTEILADFSYALPLGRRDDQTLFLGVKAGGNLYSINADKIDTHNPAFDPLLQSISNKIEPLVGAGVTYQLGDFYIAVGSGNLLKSVAYNSQKITETTSVVGATNFTAMAGYNWHISRELTLKPYVRWGMYQKQKQGHLLIKTSAQYLEKFDFGIAHEWQRTFSAYFLAKVWQNKLQLGYAYTTLSNSELQQHAQGSHEFIVKYLLDLL